ncbi:MAG: hypothetical protein ACE5HA_06020 [Anaerolineae bacterium]
MTVEHKELRRRLAEHLDQLDEKGLGQLDALLRDGGLGLPAVDAGALEPKLLSRRQLLGGLLAGGVVLGGTNTATALFAREQGVEAGRQLGAEVARVQVMAESAPALEKMQAEIDALRGLMAHYEALDRIDIDLALVRSIEKFELSLAGLPGLSGPLADGIDAVQNAVDQFQEAMPAIKQGIAQVDDTLDSLDERLDSLRESLEEVVERTAPIADALGDFFDTVLSRIPFGIGERIELVVQRLRQLIDSVPATIASVRERLLSPLRSTWFADSDEDGVQAGLLTPIRAQLLDPAGQLLTGLDDVAADWQREVVGPARRTLAEREAVRQALDEYKRRHRLT